VYSQLVSSMPLFLKEKIKAQGQCIGSYRTAELYSIKALMDERDFVALKCNQAVAIHIGQAVPRKRSWNKRKSAFWIETQPDKTKPFLLEVSMQNPL
jgi:hypothetical protein